jgi:hypothetical protein
MNDNKKVILSEDTFLHFTYKSRAQEILESGMLKTKPIYKKMGIAGNQAVSVNYGRFVPTVQTTHLSHDGADEDDPIVAVWFKTRTMPRVGYVEEVIWDDDVILDSPKIIDIAYARKLLGDGIDSDTVLIYESLLGSLFPLNS